MSNNLIETIISSNEDIRNRSIGSLLYNKSLDDLLKDTEDLEHFRKSSSNLYHKVRACLFLSFIYRHHLLSGDGIVQHGQIPFEGVKAAFDRDFEKSINAYLKSNSQNSAVFSAIADSYYKLSFKYLFDQVKQSISECKENHNLYNIKGLNDYPFAVPVDLTTGNRRTGNYPVGKDPYLSD